ncbi:acetoacetate decarboxylase family protein [Streptomyces phyllanthi]|nr:acetoacetate decarboxylase family protein [Streptomyces phyllanthi]
MTHPEHRPGPSDTPGTAYPPAPWVLRGDMFGVLLRMAPGSVPAELLPEHIRVRRRDGSVLAAVVWVDYRRGSVLEYRELMVTAMTRLTLPLTGTVLRIWVETEPSMEGGRALWRIPKELAGFSFQQHGGTGFAGSIAVGGTELASYRFTPRFTVPGRWPSNLIIRQDCGPGLRRTVCAMRGRLQVGRGELVVPEDSELAFLNSGSVITHMAIRDFDARFGVRSTDLPADR